MLVVHVVSGFALTEFRVDLAAVQLSHAKGLLPRCTMEACKANTSFSPSSLRFLNSGLSTSLRPTEMLTTTVLISLGMALHQVLNVYQDTPQWSRGLCLSLFTLNFHSVNVLKCRRNDQPQMDWTQRLSNFYHLISGSIMGIQLRPRTASPSRAAPRT